MAFKKFTVNMDFDNNTPFTFDWDEDTQGQLTQTKVRNLYDFKRNRVFGPPDIGESIPEIDQTSFQLSPEQYKDLGGEAPTFESFKLPGYDEPVKQVGQPAHEDEVKEEGWWDWANKSWLPERKTEEPFYGLQTLSKVGDLVYEKVARPTFTPIGAATAPIAAARVGRIALAGAGAGMGAWAAKDQVPEFIEDPTLEKGFDVGLSTLGMAAPYLGWKAGAFSRKPGLPVIDPVVEPPPPAGLLRSENPRTIPLTGEMPPVAEAGFESSLTRHEAPRTAWNITRQPDVFEEIPWSEGVQPPDPTVGGMGRAPGPLVTVTPKPKTSATGEVTQRAPYTRDTTVPRVGGKGEYGVRGDPMFPTVPERMQTSSTQEWMKSLLPRWMRKKGEVISEPVSIPGETFTETVIPPDEVAWNQRLAETNRIEAEAAAARELFLKENPVDEFGRIIREPKPRRKTRTEREAEAKAVVPPDTPEALKPEVQQILDTRPARKQSKLEKDLRWATTSGWSILEKMGPKGKELSEFMQRTRAEGGVKAGGISDKYRKAIDKVSDDEFKAVVDIVEGNGDFNTADPKIKEAVVAVQGALDELGTWAETTGMETRTPSGKAKPFERIKEKYFPHSWKPGTFDEESLINSLVKKGMSTEEARYVVEHGIKKGGRFISPQHMRTMDLPGYEKTKTAFFEHIDDLAHRGTESKFYGARDVGDPESVISKMLAGVEDPETAAKIVNKQLGREPKPPGEALARTINTFEAAVKLPLFAISNMNQAAGIAMRSSTKSMLKALAQSTRKSSAEQTGALQTVARNTFADVNQNAFMRGESKLLGWGKSEEMLRTWAANSGKFEVEALFTKLKKNPNDKSVRAKLGDLLLEDIDKLAKQDALTDHQKNIAGFRMAEMTQGLVDPADLPPLWSDSPLLKVPLMFKRFAFQQSRNLNNAVKAEKDPKKKAMLMAKILALGAAAGEVTEDVKDVARGGIEGTGLERIEKRGEDGLTGTKAVDRAITNVANAYTFGILGEMITQSGYKGGLAKFAIGPAATDLFEIAEPALQGKGKETAKAVIRRLPMGYSVSRRFFPPEKRGRNPQSLMPTMPKVTMPRP